ncbi:hypothetical protein MKW92_031080 [Papaver armeniacum]|nr:hypothetical protein MKW92_031080 [Papaver armeniacum]
MSIKFKFRSSVNFDTINLDDSPSVSVRDLKLRIINQSKLKICQDFDLVLSDAVTGQEYEDEDVLVESGSSVIIKRVPVDRDANSVRPAVENMAKKYYPSVHTNEPTLPAVCGKNVEVENFDDFGIDLYPAPETPLLDSDLDDDKVNCTSSIHADKEIPRCSGSGPSVVKHQNIEKSDPSEGIPKVQVMLKSKMEEHKKLNEVVDERSLVIPKADLPSELRCSLCNSIFKEAVMIPCCQHSFCDKCIRSVLDEKARCPKCSSTKCKVEDLLPNVSLRQAIEHFLESQGLMSGSDNIFQKYAPDEASGIHAKEFGCVVSIHQRDPQLPHSPSATGKGSNQVMTESAYESTFRNNGSAAGKRSASSLKAVPENFTPLAEYEGENQPSKFPANHLQNEEARRKKMWHNPADGSGNFASTGKYRKGDRTCYMCGSPDHFIRDCPVSSNQYPMLQTGDAVYQGGMPAYGPPPYWNAPQFRPFPNVYATPGMMPYGSNMVPVNPYAVHSYMPSMYAGMQAPYGVMGMGGLAPPMMSGPTGREHHLMRPDYMEFQINEQKNRLVKEHLEREEAHGGDYYPDDGYPSIKPQLSHEYKPQSEKENHYSYSDEDIDVQRSQRKHLRDRRLDQEGSLIEQRHEKVSRTPASGRDHRVHNFEESSPDIHETSNNSIRHNKDSKHNHHQRNSKTERRGDCVSDSGRKSHHHESSKEVATNRKRSEADAKRYSQKHHSHTNSGQEPSSSGSSKRHRREKDSAHSSKQPHHLKSKNHNERWEMVDGLEEDCREDHHHRSHQHHHKRKRVH